MRHFKATLTRFRGLIESKLPDGPDVYDYPGVSKAMLLRTCEEMYALAEKIETKDETGEFEIIVLKRFEGKVHNTLKKFLEEEVGSGREKEKFDEFLDKFSKLYEKTKQVYFIVNKDGLRNDLEIQNLRHQIVELQTQKSNYETLIVDLHEQADLANKTSMDVEKSLNEAYEVIEDREARTKAATESIEKALADVTNWHKQISETQAKIAAWDVQIQETVDASNSNATVTKDLLEQLQEGISELKSATEDSEKLTEATAETQQQNLILIDEIQATLGDANRVGMAGSYKTQMDAMNSTKNMWMGIFIATLVVFSAVSIGIILYHLTDAASNWQSTLTRFTMVSPLVWLAWFAVRQYGFANRVREDYTYKYATAMAYEGYKKAVREAAPDLQKALIEVAIMNMAQNPVRLYSPKDSDHATPLSEMFDKLFGRVKKVKTKTNQNGTSIEADLKEGE